MKSMLICSLLFLLPAAALGADQRRIDFSADVRPILESQCLKCHAKGKYKGGLSLETREALLKGGEEGPAAVSGKSGESLLIHLVEGREEGRRMPEKGKPLSSDQIATLKAWIDQGLTWPEGLSFGFRRAPLEPRRPEVPASPAELALTNPIDRFVADYVRREKIDLNWNAIDDRRFARRVYLDLIGLIPTPEQLAEYEADKGPGKEQRLVAKLLADRRAYADHWLTFWNDALRNSYRGTGFIDNGRKTITKWLYQSLYDNKPYNQFTRELISPVPGSEGFTKGIIWRGVVNASQAPPVQAAQNLSQVFLATNLKCASCHDSFVNRWKLTEAYSLAAVFSDKPLEINRCDKPTGQFASVGFIFPELGTIDPKASREARMKQLSEQVVSPRNGRFSRTIVNRLWAHLMGRGLVEPLDDLDQAPWSQDLLDWLAEDLVAHGYDLKHTLALIATSRVYRLPSMGVAEPSDRGPYRFQGPLTRRMTAEQFADAISTVTGVWPTASGDMTRVDGRGQGGQLAAVREVMARESKSAASNVAIPGVEAAWVWSHSDARRDKGGRILLRKSVTLDQVPERVFAVATCDNEFVLYINGKKASEGSEWSKPVSADVTSLFRKGENIIAVEATNWPDPQNRKGTQVTGANPAAFMGWVGGFDQGKPTWGVGTDATWLWTQTSKPGWKTKGFDTKGWNHAVELPDAKQLYGKVDLAAAVAGTGVGFVDKTPIRTALLFNDPLITALGRPNREQVVTRRDSTATTLQALEMTNGATLDARLKSAAAHLLERGGDPKGLIKRVFLSALGREPNAEEEATASELIGSTPTNATVQDLLWAVIMLPEFQLIR